MFDSNIIHKIAVSTDKDVDLLQTENQHCFFVFQTYSITQGMN